jgi:hypothetical protein
LQRFLSVVEPERPLAVFVVVTTEPIPCFLTCNRQETLFRAILNLSRGWPHAKILGFKPSQGKCPSDQHDTRRTSAKSAKFSSFSVKWFHRQTHVLEILCINRHRMAPSGCNCGQRLPARTRSRPMRTKYFARTIESTANRASGNPQILFKLLPNGARQGVSPCRKRLSLIRALSNSIRTLRGMPSPSSKTQNNPQ